ncbi:UvrD-helicase domain-containing protein [bacterium]|nr:UvrD-helicase domain-containing protein [bacterium]
MFIEGSLVSDKTDILIDKYVQLLNEGISASQILVLVQNSTLKNEFTKKVLEKLDIDCIEKLQIHSFYSLVYNTVSDNWAFLEDRNVFDNPVILPNLSGLEISQFILKDILKEVPFKGYNSRMSLIQQIFRRYSLIIQNNLSQSEIDERAKILKEGFSDDASLAIKKLLRKTLELRGFDYLRQCLLFNFIYKNTSYFKDIKYLFIDDADECTPICIDFIDYLSQQLCDFYIAIDPLGSSRCGYLSADKNNYERLKRIFSNDLPPIACGDFPLKGGRNACDKLCPLQGQRGLHKGIRILPYIKNFSRSMRKNMTIQELKIWNFIRKEQLGIKFRRQHPIDNKYIADFACPEHKIIIEIDGSQHIESSSDEYRTFYIENIGYKIVRFYNNEIDNNIEGCIEYLKSIINEQPPIACGDFPLKGGRNTCDKLCPLQGGNALQGQRGYEADKLFANVVQGEFNKLENFSYISFSKRSQMAENVINKINELIKNGTIPCEISIISPVIDDMLKFTLKNNLKTADLMFLTGSEKLIQNRLVLGAITVLKLNTELKNTLSEFDIRVILSEFLKIPVKYCQKILYHFEKTKELIPYEFGDSEYTQKYSDFLKLIQTLSVSDKKISEQIINIYDKLFTFEKFNKNEINKFNFFIKQIRDFEDIFGAEFNKRKTDIILQIENSVISENPYSVLEIEQNDLIISTPQKIIDNHIRTKYQFWLDISNSEWIKSDTGPLYNAWVFQKDWDKDTYTIDDNIKLSADKNARVLRKLCLCASEHIFCYSSLFDSNGVENYGGIEEYIITSENEKSEDTTEQGFKITPRADQKPVLDYEKGYMGISAVPGAGKTTILLALIIKLLDKGINPENIFVLTYMDSAARNFRERIKNVRKNSSKLPNISTIHGLALRILKENGNYEKLGLNADFEICDDSQRGRILREISQKLGIEQKTAEEFDRAVSTFKMNGGILPKNITDKKLQKFATFYKFYIENLKEFNLIDYDDMLTGSVKLLEENPDILAYYQNICQYLIEDEAQDSSLIQQKLITLLGGKYKNIIRCGDVNQSITATFSNADVDGFRKFITENYNVSMNCSQRCSKDVWELANRLVTISLADKTTQNAFFKMFMQPVEGKNPVEKNAVISEIFDTSQEEKSHVLKIIRETLSKHPDYTVGILLRWNYQVEAWQNLIENAGFKVITRNQCLAQKSVFRAIFAVMKIVLHPFDNDILGQNYDILSETGRYKYGLGEEIKKYENPFIQLNCDNLNNQSLEQFYWDVNYWISLCALPPNELVVKVAQDLGIMKSEIDKSNIHLISTLIKRICIKNNSLSYAVERLSELSKRPNLSGFKFFSEEDEDDKKSLQGKVQIMTMHKSKGDEFNLVFMPEMSEKNLPLSIDSINLKNADFIEQIRCLNPNYKKKSDFELKKEILEENLRLLYVAITRAKNRLYITTSTKEQTRYGKTKNSEPSMIFDELLIDSSPCERKLGGVTIYEH